MKPTKNKLSETKSYLPLATRLRPRSLDEFVGQDVILGVGKPLRVAIEKGILHSMVLWGPPGTGKTTLAQLMADHAKANFVRLSAIFSGVKDIRLAVESARASKETTGQETILFIDEVHRFNKAQQDMFLPFIEDGTFIFIGATTENPSFELNSALLSRARVYVLKRLSENDLLQVVSVAIHDKTRGLGGLALDFPEDLQRTLVSAADGDARQTLNLLEVIAGLATANPPQKGNFVITQALLTEVLQTNLRRFDKQGEAFYDQISALHKSVRGSSPDAALYWLARMLDGGADPRYLARRIIRMANEDVGLADIRALDIAMHAANVYERLGSPEGELALAEAVVYMACAPKSNAIYKAYSLVKEDVKKYGSLEVPLHIRNAPTQLMKNLSYGKHYRYSHDEPEAYSPGETYLPEELLSKTYYHPSSRGLEIKIGERLAYLKKLDAQEKSKK